MSVLGVLICGVSVGIFRTAALGVDPFQSLMSGLNALVPLRFGTLYLLANAALLLFSLVLDRRKLGLATLINLTLLGYVAEFSEALLAQLLGRPALVGRLGLLAAALVLMCLGAAFYFNADLGVSTYDALSLIASERQTRVPFRFCRVASDLACVAAAALCFRIAGQPWSAVAAAIGPATLLTAFCMGPLISFFSGLLPDPCGKRR